jgi:hypothetical protein
MISIWELEKKIKAKGYSECAQSSDVGVFPIVYYSYKHFNGGEIVLYFKCTSNKNVESFDLRLWNRRDIEILLTRNTVDELDNLLKKEELLHKALENAVKTLREAESE